jgi:hypothetical protein
MRLSAFLLASGVLVSPGVGVALAGPCSDQIAELSRLTSGGGAPATTGATSGAPSGSGAISNPGATTVGGAGAAGAAAAPGMKPGEASEAGTGKQSADQRSGTREMSAVAGQIATSPEDVRRQQEGRPTTAQAADQASERLPLAKAKLEQARLLDEQGNAGCMNLVNEARAAMEAK